MTRRWQDWVSRGATVTTRKDQAQDSPGTRFELLRTHISLRPVMTAAVAIAEPRLDRASSSEDKLVFFPFLPWPWPQMVGAHLIDGDPDTLWLMPRSLTVDDF